MQHICPLQDYIGNLISDALPIVLDSECAITRGIHVVTVLSVVVVACAALVTQQMMMAQKIDMTLSVLLAST